MHERRRGKVRVAVLFGGQSSEHDVSLRSAQTVMGALDPDRYEVVPIGITREGRWLTGGDPFAALTATSPLFALGEGSTAEPAPEASEEPAESAVPAVFDRRHRRRLSGAARSDGRGRHGAGAAGADRRALRRSRGARLGAEHGQGDGEDDPRPGRSAAGAVAAASRARSGSATPTSCTEWAGEILGCPCFVKPANMGSSVGVVKVHDPSEFPAAMARGRPLRPPHPGRERRSTPASWRSRCSATTSRSPRSSARSFPAMSSTTTTPSTSTTDSELIVPAPIDREHDGRDPGDGDRRLSRARSGRDGAGRFLPGPRHRPASTSTR